MTNKEFAETNAHFRRVCRAANVEPTTRQASKYRNRKGSAFAARAIEQALKAGCE